MWRISGRKLLSIIAVAGLAAWPPRSANADGQYRLGPGDLLSISVLNRSDLSLSERIRRDGTVSVHMLGNIRAANKTAAEIESELNRRIEDKTGLPASVVVDVAEWRPVHVLGDVAAPGEMAFRPGMTVGRLLAAAGGLFPRESTQTPFPSVMAQIARLNSEIGVRRARLAGLHARRLRLQAQDDGLGEIVPDDEFLHLAGPAAAALIDAENKILASARIEDKQLAKSARRQAELAANEARLLASQQDILRQNIHETATELGKMEKLLERGLTSTDRVREIRSTQSQDKIELMQAGSFEARALQTRVALLDSIEQQRTIRQRQAATSLEQTQSDIRNEMAEIAGAEQTITQLTRIAAGAPLLPPAYRIQRPTEDGEQAIEAELATLILPGDLLIVRRGGFDAQN